MVDVGGGGWWWWMLVVELDDEPGPERADVWALADRLALHQALVLELRGRLEEGGLKVVVEGGVQGAVEGGVQDAVEGGLKVANN